MSNWLLPNYSTGSLQVVDYRTVATVPSAYCSTYCEMLGNSCFAREEQTRMPSIMSGVCADVKHLSSSNSVTIHLSCAMTRCIFMVVMQHSTDIR